MDTMPKVALTRAEFCIAQSVIAAIRNISSMYESSPHEQEIHVGEGIPLLVAMIKENTSLWQRENAADFLKFLPEINEKKGK